MQLLSSFLGGAFEPDAITWSDDRIWDTVGAELKRILRVSVLPQPVAIFRHERALAQYKVGHDRLVTAIRDEVKRNAGLFLTGNYLGGAGVADCIEQGQRTAEAVAGYLRSKR
jgi:oxygen-dependent protoporphyrinogen oxidase